MVNESGKGSLAWRLYLAKFLVYQRCQRSKILLKSFKLFDESFLRGYCKLSSTIESHTLTNNEGKGNEKMGSKYTKEFTQDALRRGDRRDQQEIGSVKQSPYAWR